MDKEDYEAKDAARTIMEAHEIMANKELMARAKPFMDKKLKALQSMKKAITSLDDLKEAGKKLVKVEIEQEDEE